MMPDMISMPVVERLGWVLLHAVWQAALVAAVLRAVLYAFPDDDAPRRYAACLIALVLLVALPAATWVILEPDTSVSALALEPAEAAWLAAERPADHAAEPLNWRAHLEHLVQPALPYLVLIWGLGVVAFALRILGGWMQVQALRRRGVQRAPAPWPARFHQLADWIGLARPVRLLASVQVDVPMMIGVVRPVVLVPMSVFAGLPHDQVEAILAHELVHVRRHDYLINLLQVAVETLLFFHPAAWWVSQQLRVEREFACDAMAAAACADRLVYARALTEVAALNGRSAWLAPAARDGSLRDRVERLVRPPGSAEMPWTHLAAAALVLALTAGVLVSACAPRAVEDAGAEQTPAVDTEEGDAERSTARADTGRVEQERRVIVRGDSLDDFVVVVPGEHDDHMAAAREHADTLRRRHEAAARRLQRRLDRLGPTRFFIDADSIEHVVRVRLDSLRDAGVFERAERMAHRHVDSLRDAGFFDRIDSLAERHARRAERFVLRFDSLHGGRAFHLPHMMHRLDSMWLDLDADWDFDVDFDSLHAAQKAMAFNFDSLHAGRWWHDDDSVRVFFGRMQGQMPDRLLEEAERLERRARRLRERAREMGEQ